MPKQDAWKNEAVSLPEGTEAGPRTAVGLDFGRCCPGAAARLSADRPFLPLFNMEGRGISGEQAAKPAGKEDLDGTD